MTPVARISTAFLLAFMLAFTAQSMAVARGMPGPDGTLVICTGSGPVMIYLDADGHPVKPPHICPDAALSLIQTGFDAPTSGFFENTGHIATFVEPHRRLSGHPYVFMRARGPPSSR